MMFRGILRRSMFFLLIIGPLVVLFLVYRIYVNPPANKEVKYKLALINEKLAEGGYRTWYFVCSGKRSVWYNDLIGGKKKSFHLQGKAIDIIVFDINGDWVFNRQDITVLEKINALVEKEHPELTGAFGTYRKEGGLNGFMVHLDTRGRKVRYDE